MTVLDYLLEKEDLRWDVERNASLDPGKVTAGSHRKAWWQCEKGHSWEAAVYSITGSGTGCPYCFGKAALPGETDLETLYPELTAQWDWEKNSADPKTILPGAHEKVWWKCGLGHSWQAAPFSRTKENGSGCPYCTGRMALPGETDLETLYPELAAQWDREKNSTDPKTVLPGAHEKVWWKCALGHSWQAAPFSRTKEKGTGCPYCTGKKVLSGFNDLATLRPKLANEWYQPMNENLTPEEVTLGSNKKVWWSCADRHVWQAAIYSRTRTRAAGCPICAGTVKKPKRIPGLTRHTA